MPKAAIYDMDELMVDSTELHVVSFDRLLQEDYGCSFEDIPADMYSNFVGRRIVDICKDVIGYFDINTDLEVFQMKRDQLFLEMVRKELKMLPGLIESLDLFRSIGYKIAIASSGTREYIDCVLDKFDLHEYFDVIVSGDDVSIGKPHPEIYLKASEKLGYEPHECVVLEDAENGIASAVDAGCKCIGIVNVHTPPQDRSRADIVLDSLAEVTKEQVQSLS